MNTRTGAILCAFAFFLTGVGTALLGATLPATLHQWHLSDGHGGLLLMAAWGGSTSGALFARGPLERAVAIGLALSSFGLFALSGHRPSGLLLWYAVYGVGLGLTMTAVSLLRSREVSPAQADVDLNRLNLLWAAGACASPALALHSLRLLSVAALYRTIGIVFAAAAGILCVLSLPAQRSVPAPSSHPPQRLRWAPLRFCLFAASSVGLESAIGSWLTTYAERSALGVTSAVSANSAFWLGLLASRGAHSVKAASWFHTRAARALHVTAVGLSLALLLTFPGQAVIPLAGFLCGFGLGPLYPYVLAVTLPRYRSVTVFVLAGVGASFVPWLTGALSTAAGSLKIGLLVPAATFVVMVLSAVAMGTARPEPASPNPAAGNIEHF